MSFVCCWCVKVWCFCREFGLGRVFVSYLLSCCNYYLEEIRYWVGCVFGCVCVFCCVVVFFCLFVVVIIGLCYLEVSVGFGVLFLEFLWDCLGIGIVVVFGFLLWIFFEWVCWVMEGVELVGKIFFIWLILVFGFIFLFLVFGVFLGIFEIYMKILVKILEWVIIWIEKGILKELIFKNFVFVGII